MSDDLHCSLSSGRSFVDPVTNWALISGVDLSRDLGGMVQAGRYPDRYFADFVHELTHHWCFHSPVGLALALLQMRARRRAILILADEPESGTDAYSVAEDLVRYESAIAVMRPLAEGLALFSEFDATPGESPVVSLPMTLAAISFGTVEEEDRLRPAPAQWNSILGRLLLRQRLSERSVERKAALLAQPLTAGAGGYLAGYLSVKNIMDLLRRRADKLWDSDLFLSYIKTFFYDDYAFVATLLDPDTEIMSTGSGERDCVEGILRYFHGRVAELLSVTTDKILGDFEEWTLSADRSKDRPDPWYVGGQAARAVTGQQRMDEWLAELRETDKIGRLDAAMRNRALWSLAQRDLFCIGSFRAPVRVNEHGRVFVGVHENATDKYAWPVFNVKSLDGVAEGSGDGSLEYFVSPSHRYSVIAVTRNNGLVALTTMSENVTPELEEQIRSYRTSLEEGLGERQLLNTVVNRVVDESSASVYRAHYAKSVAEMAEEFFIDKALAHTQESDVPAARELLRRRGFYDAFGADRTQWRSFVKLTLASALSTNREFIAAVMERDEYTLDAILASVQSCEQRHPVKLVMTYGPAAGPFFVESLV
jgi:hypothetical protein